MINMDLVIGIGGIKYPANLSKHTLQLNKGWASEIMPDTLVAKKFFGGGNDQINYS